MISKAISILLLLSTGANAFIAVSTPSARLSHRSQTDLSAVKSGEDCSRRTFLTNQAASILGAAAIVSNAQPSAAEGGDELIDVYFGCGCFWHVQVSIRILARTSIFCRHVVCISKAKHLKHAFFIECLLSHSMNL